MFIPQDQGSSSTLELATWHIWGVVGAFMFLTFVSSFFYARQSTLGEQALAFQNINRELKREMLSQPETVTQIVPMNDSGVTTEDAQVIEERIRAEYDQSIAKITAELTTLYDMETKARDITGLAPRQAPELTPETAQLGGKGGPAGAGGALTFSVVDRSMRPPHIIYGMSRPSADLILQEIRMRTQSLQELVVDMEAEVDRIARIPSIWPIKSGKGTITSRYGYRRDPMHGRLKHHDGTDISASYGSPIQATARGVVVKSAFDGEYGNLVIINHGNGLETWYAHMSMIRVKVGDIVDRHDIIGNLGSTGRSTGAHLHYEVHTNGKSVDAEKYLTD